MTTPEPALDSGAPTAPAGTVGVLLDIGFDLGTLAGLRAAVAAHAENLAVTGDTVNHLLLVASEQASNAIRNGGGHGRLRLWRDHDLLYCQVADDGPGIGGADLGVDFPDPQATGGRGLWLIRRLTDHIDIATTGSGTVVTAALRIAAPVR